MGVLEHKGRARLFYRFLSHVYDRLNPLVWTDEMRDATVGLLDIDPDDRILDVGCGTGYATAALLDHAETVHGLDQSSHQLSRAVAKFGARGPVRFQLGDAERLPFAAETFDIVWSSGSIEYWPNPTDALAECRRVARPGGQVLVVGPNAPQSQLCRRIADEIMLFYDEQEADRLFARAGFDEVEHVTIGPAYKPDVAIVSVATAN